MRAGSVWGVTAFVIALVLGTAQGASASPPVDLGSSRVLDDANVVSISEGLEIEQAIDSLNSETGADLWVVYVDTFDDPDDAEGWANQTAENNGLGPNQYLLAIAVDNRNFYLSGDSAGPVTGDQLGEIEQQSILPELRNDDWAGGAVAAANGLQSAITGEEVTTPADGDGSTTPTSRGIGVAVIWLIIMAIIGVPILIFWLIRHRKKAVPIPGVNEPAELAALPTKELERRAGSALIATDDAVKTSEEELGFAVAQYGEQATVRFSAAIVAAKAALAQAFTIKQRLSDEIPDSEQDTRAWNVEIARLCTEANATLDREAEAFDQLRQIERNAPAAIAALTAEKATVGARVPAGAARLAELASRYDTAALSTITDNASQAAERLAFATTTLDAASAAVTAQRLSDAAVGIRASEEAVDQAGNLLDTIDRAAGDLLTADQNIQAFIVDLESDIALAKTQQDPGGNLGAVTAATETIVHDVKARFAAGKHRPFELLQQLDATNKNIDVVLQRVRDSQMQAQRAQAQLQSSLTSAQAQVSAAEDYITARRGAVGADARTRLAEAGRSLVQAQQLAGTDPAAALGLAQQASRLAGDAIQLAQRDVGGFGGGNGFGGNGGGQSGGGDLMGAVLGGILINSVLGGGSNRGGGIFGGGSSGGGGGIFGAGSGGGGSRSRSAGSFGGGGTRSRRGGGRF